jgi:hypothetical protein
LGLLLASSAAASVDPEKPGLPALRARDAIETLPVEARTELRTMYLRYKEEVAARIEQGWTPGLLGDPVIEGVEDPFQPARLLQEAVDHRRDSIADHKAELAKTAEDSPDHFRLAGLIGMEEDALERARAKNSRGKGLCRDWSDDAWSALTVLGPARWTIDDRRRTARPFHSAAVACTPSEHSAVCLAFDPWAQGKPAVYAFDAWDAANPGGRIPADFFLHDLPEKAP